MLKISTGIGYPFVYASKMYAGFPEICTTFFLV